MRVQFDEVIGLWLEGQRRLAQAEPAVRPALERVTDAVVQELRRRLGGPFTTAELARLYVEQGTDWCFELAIRAAPNTPEAWDLTTVAGAAFARYVREASDYGGGRRILRRSVAAASTPAGATIRAGPRAWRSTPHSDSSVSDSSAPARWITIWSSSIVTSTGRWPAQYSA